MQILVAVDHPWPESFNHGITRRVVETLRNCGHDVDLLDLHRDGFNPLMSREELAVYKQGRYLDPLVGNYQKRIERSGHMIFIFPVWWDVMPAMLKGFFDKVFLPDWAFTEADASPRLNHISGATVITTMGAPEVIHTSVEAVLCRGILEFSGITENRRFNLCAVSNTTPEQRRIFLQDIETYLRRL